MDDVLIEAPSSEQPSRQLDSVRESAKFIDRHVIDARLECGKVPCVEHYFGERVVAQTKKTVNRRGGTLFERFTQR